MLVYSTICAHMHKLCSLNLVTISWRCNAARFKFFFSKSDNY